MENNAEAAITLSLVMLAISLAVLVGLRSHWFPSR
jgi:ABC-type sulfate transport system permease component